jgi:hypothetical protein
MGKISFCLVVLMCSLAECNSQVLSIGPPLCALLGGHQQCFNCVRAC